jgi:GTPase SAR1 family protein
MRNAEEKFGATPNRKPLRIALIGMSGAGKTFWTRRMAEERSAGSFVRRRD